MVYCYTGLLSSCLEGKDLVAGLNTYTEVCIAKIKHMRQREWRGLQELETSLGLLPL